MGGRDSRVPEQRNENKRMVSDKGYQLQYILQAASNSKE